MKRIVLFLGLILAITACSSDKATGPSPDNTARLNISPKAMSFSAVATANNPSGQNFTVKNTGGDTLRCTFTCGNQRISCGRESLKLRPGDSLTLRLNIEIAGRAPGSYLDTMLISDPKAIDSPQRLVVSVELAQTTKPSIGKSMSNMKFFCVASGPNPVAQNLTLKNVGVDTLRCTLSNTSVWLSLDQKSSIIGSGDSLSVNVSVNNAALAPGDYADSIRISSSYAENAPQIIPVRMRVDVETTLVILDSLSSHWEYLGPYLGYPDSYSITPIWRTRCYSNVSKSVELFSLIISDTANTYQIGEIDFQPFEMQSGHSEVDSLSFKVAGHAPPPLRWPWLLWIGYRFKGIEIWAKAVFIPSPNPGGVARYRLEPILQSADKIDFRRANKAIR